MKKILSVLLLGVMFIITQTGCEKEKVFFEEEQRGAQTGVGFGLPNNEPLSLTVEASSASVTQAIKAFLSVNNTGSASVTTAVDESLVESFNSTYGTDYPLMTPDVYTLPTTISISGGEGSADASFDIAALLKNGTSAAIGLKITAVSGATDYIMPGNSQLLIVIKVKNAYEGDYAVRGYFFHPSSPRSIGRDKFVSTIDPNTSYAELGDLGSLDYYFNFDTDGSTVGGWVAAAGTPAAPASGFMTLDNPAGTDYSLALANDGVAPGDDTFNKDIYNNTYDEANGIYMLHYGYGSGSTSQAGYTRQVYEKWTLK